MPDIDPMKPADSAKSFLDKAEEQCLEAFIHTWGHITESGLDSTPMLLALEKATEIKFLELVESAHEYWEKVEVKAAGTNRCSVGFLQVYTRGSGNSPEKMRNSFAQYIRERNEKKN